MAKAHLSEANLSEARARGRQSRSPALLVNAEGRLYPNVPLVAKKPEWRPYHGDAKASVQERIDYFHGVANTRRRAVVMEPEPFNLSKASADEIVAFAMEEFGTPLDGSLPINELRQQCYRLSQLPEIPVPAAPPDPQPMGMQDEAPAPRRGRQPRQQAEA